MAEIRQLIIELGLPKMDVSLFGIRCPYCGKSDRIRQLESPEDLEGSLPFEDLEKYTSLWKILANENNTLGVCKFCFNALRLDLDENSAEPLCD